MPLIFLITAVTPFVLQINAATPSRLYFLCMAVVELEDVWHVKLSFDFGNTKLVFTTK